MGSWGSEAELAAGVVAYFQGMEWDIFQEVEGLEGIADIVAVKKPITMVVETKQSLTIEVIYQAHRWKQFANRVFVAVPKPQRFAPSRRFAYEVCKHFGVGLLECTPSYTKGEPPHVSEIVTGALNRSIVKDGIIKFLRPEHKRFAKAGAAGGGHFTPFKMTCEELRYAVVKKPGGTMKEIIDSIHHHYSTPGSARSSLAHWITAGKVPGVRLENVAGKTCLYPAEIEGEGPRARQVRLATEKARKAADG